jgi:hypothetical protein
MYSGCCWWRGWVAMETQTPHKVTAARRRVVIYREEQEEEAP